MFGLIKCWFLHAQHEVGGTVESKYKAASEIFRIALRSSENQLKLLHWALDVVLCGGEFRQLESGTDLHRQYWELGHRIASEIVKHQEYLNIDQIWFEPDYEAALTRLNNKSR